MSTSFWDLFRENVADDVKMLQKHSTDGMTLNIKRLREYGVDEDTVSKWVHGVDLGAEACPATEKRNHPSLNRYIKEATAEWSRLEDLGKVVFFNSFVRPDGLNVSPCAIIVKESEVPDAPPKSRLIMDLTKGGVNSRLPKQEVAYGSVELAASRIEHGSHMFVIDWSDAFFHWKVNKSSQHELGFFSPTRGYGLYQYLPFGLSSSPGIHGGFVKIVLEKLAAHHGVVLTDFVDDFIGAAASECEAWVAFRCAIRFFLDVGICVSTKEKGLRPPSTVQIWIGWRFDSVNNTISATKEKVEKLTRMLRGLLGAHEGGVLHAKQFSSAVGLANHVSEVLFQGKIRLRSFWATLNAAGVYAMWQNSSKLDPKIVLSERNILDIKWWIGALSLPVARVFKPPAGPVALWGPGSAEFENWGPMVQNKSVLVFETDAAKEGLWCYHNTSSGRVCAGPWPEDIRGASINYKELWVVLKFLENERSFIEGWRVLIRCDNATSTHYINNRSGRVPSLAQLMSDIEKAERAALCHVAAVHIKGKDNVVADLGSRVPGWPSCWENDIFAHAMLRKNIYAHIQSNLGVTFTVDLFCDNDGYSSLAPSWRCPARSAFECNLVGEIAWCHPPSLLVFPFLRWLCGKVSEMAGLRIAILVPENKEAPWFRKRYIDMFKHAQRWPAGSDLFRWCDVSDSGEVRFRKGRKTDLPYCLLTHGF